MRAVGSQIASLESLPRPLPHLNIAVLALRLAEVAGHRSGGAGGDGGGRSPSLERSLAMAPGQARAWLMLAGLNLRDDTRGGGAGTYALLPRRSACPGDGHGALAAGVRAGRSPRPLAGSGPPGVPGLFQAERRRCATPRFAPEAVGRAPGAGLGSAGRHRVAAAIAAEDASMEGPTVEASVVARPGRRDVRIRAARNWPSS